jgi:type I restriction enzyme M protein
LHIIFNREKKNKEKVLFIDASKDFVAGKNQNSLGENHINHIVEVFTDFHDNQKDAGIVEDKFAYIATFEEIKENDYNLNIPRYVDTYEEEAEIDLTEVQQKIEQLQNELAEVQKQMDEYLKLF